MRTELSNNIYFGASFYDSFFKKLPNKDVKNAVKYNKLGKTLASPHWNRLALGVAAITTQPALDYFNPKVDKDTATSSALRTLVKIPVCTSVGFIVRGGTYKLVEKYAHLSEKEGSTLLTPKSILEMKNLEKAKEALKIHKNAASTCFALAIMFFTNFLIDAPLTTYFANKLINKHKFSHAENDNKRRSA